MYTLSAIEYEAFKFACLRGYYRVDDPRAYFRMIAVIRKAGATTLDEMQSALKARYESKPIIARLTWQYAHRCGD